MTWLMTLDASTRHLDLPLARIALPSDGVFFDPAISVTNGNAFE